MSGISEKPGRPAEVSRVMQLLFGWILYCLWLGDVVPSWWTWAAFPVIWLAARAAAGSRLRFTVGLTGILILPVLVRLVLSLFASVVDFDNGWMLTAPYLLLTAISTFLHRRWSFWRQMEPPILLPVPAWILGGNLLEFPDLSVPAAATLRLSLAVLALLLTVLGLWSGDRIVTRNRRMVRSPAGRLVHASILTAALLLLVLGGLFLRRENALREGGGVLAGDLFRFDFNDVLSLEPEISLNAELTMLYREDGPAVTRYLRRFTLSGWDESQGFYRDSETDIPGAPPAPQSLPRGPVELDAGDLKSRIEVVQEYYLIALDPTSLFSLNIPSRIEPWIIWDDASFSRAYGVTSMVSVAGPWELFDARIDSLNDGLRRYYLEGGDDEAYRELALEAAADAVGPWEQAEAIKNWFHSNYFYSLNPGVAPDGDQLDWFLFETLRGYCSYYAFAMTRMCRSLGIPARVAVGFLTDPGSSVLGFVPVRSDQAHAWVEVWLDDYGWIEFDPTSQTMAPGEDYPFRFINPQQWLPLVEEVLSRSGEIDVALPAEEETASDSWWRTLSRRVADRSRILPVILFLLIVAVYIPNRILPYLRAKAADQARDPRRAVLYRWRRFSATLVRSGAAVSKKDTVLDWAGRQDAGDLKGFRHWTDIYLKAVYSPEFEAGDRDTALGLEAEVRRRFRQLSWKRLLPAALRPGRSLPW